MEVRLIGGTRDRVGGVFVGAVNFWEREGRMTAKVVLPDESLIVGVGDVFLVGELECRVVAFEEDGKERDVLVLDVPGLDVPVVKKAVRLEESDFGPEEKVTCLFQSGPFMLGGISAAIGKFGIREGRMSGVLFLQKRTQVIFLDDEFDVGLGRFRLLAIQRTESGDFWEAFVKEIGLAHEPWSPADEEREVAEAGRLRKLRSKEIADQTFTVPRQDYRVVLEKLRELSGLILRALDTDDRVFEISRWEETRSEKMSRDPREGDLGPDVTVVKTAVVDCENAGASTKVVTTQWSPGNVAGISAGADWSVGGERVWCSLRCDKEGVFEKVCVMGAEGARDFVKEVLLKKEQRSAGPSGIRNRDCEGHDGP